VDWEDRDYNTLFARMAANIQKVLYKCGKENAHSYYLKMLLNEVETIIPGCDTVYCPWETYKSIGADWGCNNNQFESLCNGLIVFCGSAREIALSKQSNPGDGLAGPPPVGFGSSPFDSFGPFAASNGKGGGKSGSASKSSSSKVGKSGKSGGGKALKVTSSSSDRTSS